MLILTVAISTDFSAQILNNVTLIDFTNTNVRSLATAIFDADQFTPGVISSTVTIDGSTGRNGIVVNGSPVTGFTWNFTNWSANDTITFNGSGLGDLLTGTVQADRINGNGGTDEILGGLGLDKVFGGDGDDSFRYTSDAELVDGEIIDGGAGTGDLLVLEGSASATYNFLAVTITGVEQLQFEGGGTAWLAGAQVSGSGITEIIGNLNTNTLTVAGQSVDLGGLMFTNWADGGDEIVLRANHVLSSSLSGSGMQETLYGGLGDDTLSGQGGNDVIAGGEGADVMSGGAGDDKFSFGKALEIVTGEIVKGGNGFDTLAFVNGSGYDISKLTLSSVEKIGIGMFAGDIHIAGTQIGALAGLVNTVSSATGGSNVTIHGPLVDLSGVSFLNWGITPSIHIEGQSGAVNSLTGSAKGDIILGGGLDDTINGGKGIDIITGGLGTDMLTGGNQSDYFVFDSVDQSIAGLSRDRILDFSQGNDIITFTGIDAISGGSDDAFTFMGNQAFTGAGQLRFEINNAGNTIVAGDVDGDGQADFQILIIGSFTLTADDFDL